MAPSRRKGGGRASAAAAAARKQWKVGDLVLAKVKGFPAWPATVSEPEKWGYTADWKKVLVYFFGTQQIAFCNPADVEEFTEEKKESLLVKRHGRGSDFVRAVKEIIESYEKLKSAVNSIDEVNLTASVNSVGDVELKDQIDASLEVLNSSLKKSSSTEEKNEPSLPLEGAPDTTQGDILSDSKMSPDEPVDNLVVTRKQLQNTFSLKKRPSGVRPQSPASQKKQPTARRSRSSSKVDANSFQTPILPLDGSKAVQDLSVKVCQDGPVRRSNRIRKSPFTPEGHDRGSPAFFSNGSIEENNSEIVTGDSDSISLTEGSTVESGCKLLQPESHVGCCEGDELSQMLDFKAKTVLTKKKRKPNRKRMITDCPETTGGLNNETVSEIEVHKTGQISQDSQEMLNERHSRDDGDEHLPLVKRARVRMGRSSSAGEELDTLIQSEKNLLEVPNSFSVQVPTSLSSEGDSPADRNSFDMKGVADNSSPQNKCPQSSVVKQLSQTEKNQQYGCSVDDEAALPPSKRLHRALEAMSANAAEDSQTEVPSTMKTLNNGCHVTSTGESPQKSMENRERNGIGLQNLDASQHGVSVFSTSSGPGVIMESAKSCEETANCNESLRSSSPQEQELCKDIHVETVEHAGHRGLHMSSSGAQPTDFVGVVQSPKRISPALVKEQTSLGSNEGSLAHMLPPRDEHGSETPELSNHKADRPLNQIYPSECSGMSLNPASGDPDGKLSLHTNTSLVPCGESNCSETTKLLKLPLHLDDQIYPMCDVGSEIKSGERDSDDVLTSTSAKVMVASAQGPSNLSHSTSKSDDRSGDKDVSGIRSSSSPADGLDSTARVSLPNSSIYSISVSGNNNILGNNGYCSPEQHSATSKHLAKWRNRAESTAALASFEAVLATLTRTKESIGRATRIAIDCAKIGVASKVVEVLARNLESESSLHRRIDLFFLVDSITQCSRGLKGDIGGIYPSAVQAVLSRLLSAAAPPGSSALENRRQCLKVLRLWLERKILPESVIRHHIRDLESVSSLSSSGAFSRRPLRTERAFDDPIREMEGMLVDEYGSNSSFQLPGFRMPPMLKDEDEGSDSDGGSFEAVTPEHNPEIPEERERISVPPAIGKHKHILEDVEGELEMEDVAPACGPDMSSTSNAATIGAQMMHSQFQHFPVSFAPPLPRDVPPSSPPLPTSPPPLSSALLPPPDGHDSELYMAKHTIKENMQNPVVPQPIANSLAPDSVCYHVPQSRDVQMQTPMPDSANSCSFSSAAVSHLPIQHVNQQADGATFHNTAYNLRPPQPTPSNQFSYVQAERVQSLRDVPPPSYPSRGRFTQNTDTGNFYSDHDRMKMAPHDLRESWRFSGPSLSGTYHSDPAARGSYPPPYGGPRCEPPLPNHRWGLPPRAVDHRGEPIPHGTPSQGPIPVANRAVFRILRAQIQKERVMHHSWCVLALLPTSSLHFGGRAVSSFPQLSIKILFIHNSVERMGASESVPQQSIHEFTVKDSRGTDVDLSIYKGKVLLVVNVASKCGFTDSNYKQLTELHNKYKDKGFEVLAFPCNQFLHQEPGTSLQAEEFACTRYKAEYPIFQKVRVNGPDTAPVYKFLKANKGGFLGSRIKWNFTKFLVEKEGHVIRRYAPTTSPLAIEKDIQKALGEV
ncbi:protein HUA2-LIKE 2-like [Diospyros lotus]|uniref:protein HUA2-LIKE 2-like n=1 Tax=Diospyros lotus TaxID=55363 RepID=UPI00224C8AE0|nr:protein HUA2-LIKE 2-like [Diospyros lotus]